MLNSNEVEVNSAALWIFIHVANEIRGYHDTGLQVHYIADMKNDVWRNILFTVALTVKQWHFYSVTIQYHSNKSKRADKKHTMVYTE